MLDQLKNWFRRNAYGKFSLRLLVALGSAAVAVALSFLPHDTILQAIWVVASSMFMGYVVLRQRLNETDDRRYERLINTRFTYLQKNDPEALNTIFADNLRPRMLDWFHAEYGVNVGSLEKIDALDSLARNGDSPGQLILRTGVEFGRWFEQVADRVDKIPHFNYKIGEFISQNESLLGQEVENGIYFRKIKMGEQVPTGIHMFHPESRLLMSLKLYEQDESRHSLSLSTRTHLFEVDDQNPAEIAWENFKEVVLKQFPEFEPVNGGSGPQKMAIPFFVSAVSNTQTISDDELQSRLRVVAAAIPEEPAADTDSQSDSNQ